MTATPINMQENLRQLEQQGFTLVKRVLTDKELFYYSAELQALLESGLPDVLKTRGVAYGVRNVTQLWPEVAELALHPAIREIVLATLGPSAGLVLGEPNSSRDSKAERLSA